MAVGREPGAPAGNHRAAWVMRGCKGVAHNGARAREQGGGGDAQQDGLGCGRPSRAPRRWRGGAMGTSRPTATGPYGNERAARGMAMGADVGGGVQVSC